MSILVKFCKCVKNIPKYRFLSKFSNISILVKIVEKSQIWSNLQKNLDFGQTCRKFSILVKIYQNVDFGINFKKDFNFAQNFRKYRFW